MPDFIHGGPSFWGDAERTGATVERNAEELKQGGPDYWGDLTASTEELTISGTPVLTGQDGEEYAGFTVVASGGSAPYTYSVSSGALPAGITLDDETGEVAGTPSVDGEFADIVITATDSQERTADLDAFTLTIEEAA